MFCHSFFISHSIITYFRDLKEMGKMGDNRVRNKEGMTKHITLCFVAHTLFRILQFQKIQFNVQPVHRQWYKKAKFSMGQIRGMVQNESMLLFFFGLIMVVYKL